MPLGESSTWDIVLLLPRLIKGFRFCRPPTQMKNHKRQLLVDHQLLVFSGILQTLSLFLLVREDGADGAVGELATGITYAARVSALASNQQCNKPCTGTVRDAVADGCWLVLAPAGRPGRAPRGGHKLALTASRSADWLLLAVAMSRGPRSKRYGTVRTVWVCRDQGL